MRLLFLSILLIIPLKGFSCQCRFQNFESSVESAPFIFEGRILNVSDKEHNPYFPLKKYEVVVLNTWKGELQDTVDLYTGSGGGDCGSWFEIGKTYLIWTSQQYRNILNTNFCTRTSLIDLTPDVDLLNHIFKNIAYDSIYLTNREIGIIKRRMNNDSIDLTKVSLFFEGDRLLTKKELIDAIYQGMTIDIFKVPSKKLKLLPENASHAILVFQDQNKRPRPSKIIRILRINLKQAKPAII